LSVAIFTIWNESDAGKIFSVIENGLKCFDPEKSNSFYNYICKSLNAANSEKQNTINIPPSTYKRIKKVIKLHEEDKLDADSIAEILCIKQKTVEKYLRIYQHGTTDLSGAEPFSDSTEDSYILKTERQRLFCAMCKRYEKMIKYEKPKDTGYLSALVTRECLVNYDSYFGEPLDIKHSEFGRRLDTEMIKHFETSQFALPSQKEIAEKFGKKEADASRKIKEFFAVVKKLLDTEQA